MKPTKLLSPISLVGFAVVGASITITAAPANAACYAGPDCNVFTPFFTPGPTATGTPGNYTSNQYGANNANVARIESPSYNRAPTSTAAGDLARFGQISFNFNGLTSPGDAANLTAVKNVYFQFAASLPDLNDPDWKPFSSINGFTGTQTSTVPPISTTNPQNDSAVELNYSNESTSTAENNSKTFFFTSLASGSPNYSAASLITFGAASQLAKYGKGASVCVTTSTCELFFRYELPALFTDQPGSPFVDQQYDDTFNGQQIKFTFRTNNRGCRGAGGVLGGGTANCVTTAGNAWVNNAAALGTHTYKVPGPLPLLGAAAAFSASRRLRRRTLQPA